jgi:hypothetical protein
LGINLVGAAMHSRFAAEGKPGSTMLKGANYSTWFNGGLRTTTYFHNMIGLLTETIGNPTPMSIPFLPNRLLPSADLPNPITPQQWHFRQSIEYSLTANRAVLDVASKHREDFLFNIYRMGRNSIERGSRDHWTITPKDIAAVQEAIAKERGGRATDSEGPSEADAPGPRFTRGAPLKFFEAMKDPAQRDPRGYILPSDQADFLTATKFVNALIKTGITIHRATAPFQAGGKSYPAGSYVVKTAQAFRPHILDMFEPQDHPNDIPYPGGPPTPPYDNAGWTLAYQMGVQFDRLLDGFDGPFEKVNGLIKPDPGRITGDSNPAGYLLSHKVNDAFVAINRLLKNGEEVYWLADRGGDIYVPAKTSTRAVLDKLVSEVGLSFTGVAKPSGAAYKLRPVRIGLWDRYGGSMPSGWTRWLFEQFEFPYEVVYPQTLDAGNLSSKYDVLVFVDGGIPGGAGGRGGGGGGGGGGFGGPPNPEALPAEFRGWLGSVTTTRTVPQLKKFLEDGGTVLTVGGSTSLARHLGLPVSNHLVDRQQEGDRPLPREKYYVPGSILRVRVDNTHPLAYGMPERADVFFNNSPVLKLRPEAAIQGFKPVAWFDSASPLRSGWAWGQHLLEGGVAIAEAPVGKGKLFLLGPEVTNRAQPHGTFKLFFNGIYYGTAQSTRM